MTMLIYDGSFAGWLTTVFEVYERKLPTVHIMAADRETPDAFAARMQVITDEAKAARVWNGILRHSSPDTGEMIWRAFLSELAGVEDTLLVMVRYLFSGIADAGKNYGHPAVLETTQTARKVWREKHRMEAFVRFRRLGDGLFYAGVEPDHNVLPLIAPHFKGRYADQQWLIYDLKRKYGIYHDHATGEVREVNIDTGEGQRSNDETLLDPSEPAYQELWKAYFRHTAIPERKNLKLHLRHVPRRYWKYLVEKR